jgi:topoisomerase-4 subunit A
MDTENLSVIDAPFDAALSGRSLVSALSTITARSLPGVRDGLKQVHRRLLWAMRLLRLDPANAYKKCARVVGDARCGRSAAVARFRMRSRRARAP